MKTAVEILDACGFRSWGTIYRDDITEAMKAYGAQVREEAAKIAETLPCCFHPLVECHDACAAAIRKMELP